MLSADQMLAHIDECNQYYFGEIGVAFDRADGLVLTRKSAFNALERRSDFLGNRLYHGNMGEDWTLKKVLRRFLWHDRIHAKALYRLICRDFPEQRAVNPFFF